MTRKNRFELCEARMMMDGHLVGALADVTTPIADLDLTGHRISITASAEMEGMLLLTLKAEGAGNGSEIQLWTTDGSRSGSTKITEFTSGGYSAVETDMAVVGDQAFFVTDAWINVNPPESDPYLMPAAHLWRTNGTVKGTHFVTAISGPAYFDVQLYAAGTELLI